MKILINAVSARAGGGVSYLLKLLEWLPKCAPNFSFLVTVPEMKIPETCLNYPNLEIKQVKEASGNILARYYWENTSLISLCKSWKADMLLCVANIAPIFDPGIPVIVMIQNVAPLTPRVSKLLYRFESLKESLQLFLLKKLTLRSIKNANAVISLSHATADLLKEWVPGLESHVLYHGVSSNFNPAATPPPDLQGKDYFLSVSNLYVYKGIEYIIDALAYDKELPPVYIAGRNFAPNYVKWLKERALQKKVTDRIIFLDRIKHEDLPGWYANAKAMVYSSWCENCPNILMESMGCSCPVIAMDIGPMKEICQDAGFYAKPFDGKSLANAMRQALKAPTKEIGDLAIKQAQKFSWQAAMEEHIKVFKKVIKKNSGN